MRIALVDVGTASVRCEIFETAEGSAPTLLHRERHMPRLGESLYEDGAIGEAPRARVLDVCRSIHAALLAHKPSRVIAVATSALRESTDGEALVADMSAQLGHEVRVISGDEEAALIAKGILANEPRLPARCVLVDIGGGSTELSMTERPAVHWSISVPLGALRAQLNVLHEAPPPAENVAALRRQVATVLEHSVPSEHVAELVGSSGTARALCRMIGRGERDDAVLELAALQAMRERLERLTPEEIAAIPGIESNRADIILGGAIILEEIFKHFSARCMRPTVYSLRHGLLAEALA